MANWQFYLKSNISSPCSCTRAPLSSPAIKSLFLVFAHTLATIAKLLRPGGRKARITENLLLKQQLLITEQLVGTIQQEYFDQTLFWNGRDLEKKLGQFQDNHNAHRVHQALNLNTPAEAARKDSPTQADLRIYAWNSYCGGLF